MDLAAKRRLREGWMGLVTTRPGGMRGGRMLRFAEADTDSASAFRLCAFNTALARKGLAVFNRSAHSAGPAIRNGQSAMGNGRGEIGDGKWEIGNGSWKTENRSKM